MFSRQPIDNIKSHVCISRTKEIHKYKAELNGRSQNLKYHSRGLLMGDRNRTRLRVAPLSQIAAGARLPRSFATYGMGQKIADVDDFIRRRRRGPKVALN